MAKPNTEPRWLTFKAGAVYASVSVRTIENWNAAGAIKTTNIIRPGATRGKRLVCRQSLDRMLEQGVGVKTQATVGRGKGGA